MESKTSITFKPAATQRASDVIYEQIYQKIIDGELQPGDRLPSERELAEQFDRSRPSVREALRMLQQDRLIKITVGVNGGAVVQGISLESAEQPLRQLIDIGAITLKELVDYRSSNDYTCARLATLYHTENDIKELKKIIEDYKNAVYNSEELEKVDIAFHRALARSSHNKLCILMTDVVTSLCTTLFWSVAANGMAEEDVISFNLRAYENHAAILDAVIEKDAVKLTKLMNAATELFNESIGDIDLQ